MLKNIAQWNNWLGNRMFFIVLTALFMGFNFPLTKSPLLTSLAVVLFAYMTFITALGTSYKEVVKVLDKPGVVLWMLFLVHAGAPLVSWFVGLIFYPQDELIRLGLLISAAIPVAVTSIIWTSLTGGSVPLSLVVVTLDTIAVPVVLPAFFLIAVGKVLTINYAGLILQLLLMVTIPSIAGMVLNDMTAGRLNQFSRTAGAFTSKAAIFLVVFLNSAMVASDIVWDASLIKLLSVIFILVAGGYLLGFAGSFALKERKRETVSAMIYNVGMRNIAFGAVLALTYFPAKVVITISLAMLFQQPAAAVVAYFLKKYMVDSSAAKDVPKEYFPQEEDKR